MDLKTENDILQKEYRKKFLRNIPKKFTIHKKVIRNLEKNFFIFYGSNGQTAFILELNEKEIGWAKNSKFMEENNLQKELENKNIVLVRTWNGTMICKTYQYYYLKFKDGEICTEYCRGQKFLEFYELYNIKFGERKYAPYPLQLKSMYKMCPSLRGYVIEYLKVLSETNIFIKDLVKDYEKNRNSLMVPVDFSLLEIAKNKKHLLEIKTKTKLIPVYNRISLNHAYSVIKSKKYINESEVNKLLTLDSDINKNCVFTYLDKINNGKCIIYTTIWRKKKYTIEFTVSKNKFILNQISGYRNSVAPRTLIDKINKLLENQRIKSA